MIKYTIGIIGGTGMMGQWFEAFFKQAGHRVVISGRQTPMTTQQITKTCDVVIISTPIDAAISICSEIGPSLSEHQLLMDFCSLKERIVQKMAESTRAAVIGTHPMFGPFTESINGRNVVICPLEAGRWVDWLENLLSGNGARVTRMDPAAHDRNMAVVQGLTHLLTICMGKTLQKLDLTPDHINPCSTPIFKLNMDLLGRLFSQDLDLYANLIGKNAYMKDALEVFVNAFNEGKACLINGNNGEKQSYLGEIRTFLGDFCETGFSESNKILNGMYPDNGSGAVPDTE